MSQIPSKQYPKENPWKWVDHQLDKLLTANKKLKKENSELKGKYNRLCGFTEKVISKCTCSFKKEAKMWEEYFEASGRIIDSDDTHKNDI